MQIRVTDVLTVLRESVEGEPAVNEPVERLILPKLPPPGGEAKSPTDAISRRWLPKVPSSIAATQERFAAAQHDLEALEEALPARRAALERLPIATKFRKPKIDPDLFSVEQIGQSLRDARSRTLNRSAGSWQQVWARLDGLTGDDCACRRPSIARNSPVRSRNCRASCWSCRCCRPGRGWTRSRSSRSISRPRKRFASPAAIAAIG